MVPLDGGKSQRSRGGGGRAPRAQSMGGGLWPRPCFGFAGLGGPRAPQTRKTPPPPGAPQRRPATPTPARFRRPYSGGSVAPRKAPAFQRGAAAFGAVGRPAGPPHCRQTKERARGQRPRAPLFQGASRPAAAVRKGRCASPPRRLPSTPLRTGLPPRFFRHWRRSAPPPLRRVFHQRQKDPKKRLPQTKRAAPDERRASIIRRKTGKVFQLVFPRFFKSGWGSGGKAPGKIQRYPQRPYAVSISKAASRRHTQNTSRAASSSATGGRLGAMRILLSWGSLP